jgi:hypothetical protein
MLFGLISLPPDEFCEKGSVLVQPEMESGRSVSEYTASASAG